ncbi:MAG: serine/threonine protein kinase, partial [Candidatus Muiribacteriaceae bacterium]
DIGFRELGSIDWERSGLSQDEMNSVLYDIAEVFEERNLEKESIFFYRIIFGKDVNFRDVREKIEKLDTKILMSRTIDETTGLSLDIRRRYDDIEELGKGGMGVVYKATDRKLGRKVALKVMLSEFVNNREAVSRFLKEARAIAALNHPGIVSIFDVNSDKNVYIAMEYVEGVTLKRRLQESGKINIDDMSRYGREVCLALDYAHQNGVVHRDIKPENIMIDKEGKIKIMDFGLATVKNEKGEKEDIVGTPFFMSPEQITGEELDYRTDIYSFGVSIYQLLTGKLPFEDGDIRKRHLEEKPIPPSAINPDLNYKIDQIILRCLEKDPDKRYSSMKDIEKELSKVKYVG